MELLLALWAVPTARKLLGIFIYGLFCLADMAITRRLEHRLYIHVQISVHARALICCFVSERSIVVAEG